MIIKILIMLVAIIVAIIIIINKWKSIKDKKNNCSFLTFHYTIPTETIIPTIFIDNKPKVYCKDCKHYKFLNKYSIWRNCINPNNIKEINTPLEKETYLIKQFMTINKDNNCSWYEPKEEIKDIKLSPEAQKKLKKIQENVRVHIKEHKKFIKKGAKNVKDNKKRNNKN